MDRASRSDCSHDSSERENGITQSGQDQNNADDTENACLFFTHTGQRNRNLITLMMGNRMLNSRSVCSTLVLTGSFDGYTRSELRARIEDNGGRVTSSVSGNTDILFVGADPGDRKREQAKTNDVPIGTTADLSRVSRSLTRNGRAHSVCCRGVTYPTLGRLLGTGCNRTR